MNSFLKYSLVLFFGITTMYSQTTTNQYKEPSAISPVILDMSTIDESIVQGDEAKGFVLPVVEIDNLLDTVQPVKNPAEGLIVYNQGKYRIAGVYMFKNGMWSAIVNRGSSIENAVADVVSEEINFKEGSYFTLKLNELIFDNTYGDVNVENNSLKLLPGNYLITIHLAGKLKYNLGNSIGQTSQSVRAHLINMRSKIEVNGREGLNTSFVDVLVPMSGKNPDRDNLQIETSRAFTTTFYFAVVIEKNTEGIVKLLISTQKGTTYGGNNIEIVDSFVNIEKSIL